MLDSIIYIIAVNLILGCLTRLDPNLTINWFLTEDSCLNFLDQNLLSNRTI